MHITLNGKVISKKNSKRVGVNKWTHRIYVTSSKAWAEFEEDAMYQLMNYKKLGKFTGKVRIDYLFYFKGKEWLDFDNAITGINDLLQASGIIQNDHDIEKGSFEVFTGCLDWKTEIEITEIENKSLA